MKRITISSSLKFTDKIKSTISKLEKIGVIALFSPINKLGHVDLETIKGIVNTHFKSIDNSEALYVICPNGYVGKSVSAEIGYAVAQKKPVIFSETPEDLGIQAMATSYLPLEEVEKIKEL